jgi:hypothetical protein
MCYRDSSNSQDTFTNATSLDPFAVFGLRFTLPGAFCFFHFRPSFNKSRCFWPHCKNRTRSTSNEIQGAGRRKSVPTPHVFRPELRAQPIRSTSRFVPPTEARNPNCSTTDAASQTVDPLTLTPHKLLHCVLNDLTKQGHRTRGLHMRISIQLMLESMPLGWLNLCF